MLSAGDLVRGLLLNNNLPVVNGVGVSQNSGICDGTAVISLLGGVSGRARGQVSDSVWYLDKVGIQLNGLGSICDSVSVCLETNVGL